MILFFQLGYSQINNGEIHYQVVINSEKNIREIEAMSVSPTVKKMLIDSYQSASPVKLILTFQNNWSKIVGKPDLKTETNSTVLLILSGAKKDIYTSQNPQVIYTSGGLMGDILIKEDPPVWTLVDETKKIGDYECYKARGYILGEGNSGPVKKEFEAWYTPEIPVQYGPYLYSGLPGLVLQVNFDDDLRFEATEILLDLPDVKEIQLPNLKIISRNEANQKLKGYLRD